MMMSKQDIRIVGLTTLAILNKFGSSNAALRRQLLKPAIGRYVVSGLILATYAGHYLICRYRLPAIPSRSPTQADINADG